MVQTLLNSQRYYRWLIFWILAFGYVLVYFHRLCPAVVAVDIMKDLNTGATLTGFLAAAYFYPYAAMQLPAGLLSDSWGPRKTISLFFCIAFIGCIFLGLAPSVFWAIVGRTLVGFGVAILFVCTMKILAEWFHVTEFAIMTGILMAMGGIGSLSASTPLVWLSGLVGWRYSFVIIGIFTIFMSLLVWLVVSDKPSDRGWKSPSEKTKTNAPQTSLWEGVKIVITCPWFWPLAIWFFCICGIFFSFGGLWGGPYLMHVYGLNKTQSGHILSMLAIGLIIGSLIHGYVSNNIIKARKPVIIFSTAIVIGITSIMTYYTNQIPIVGLYLICLGLGIFSSAIVVVGFTTNKELFPVSIAGTATGIVNFFPFMGGAVFQPLLGYILEQSGRQGSNFTSIGYRNAFLVLLISSIIAFIASLFIKETLRKSQGM